MSLLSMPFLVLNFGGEMIYILEQRLHAQNIPKDKCNKVLQDVTRAMFSPKFISELLKPQPIYSPTSTREIFDRLAHSSIMRLSESSMDKLFDLMTMGFKYQLVSCTHPRDLVDVTLNHLDSIRNAVEGSEATAQQVDAAIATMIKLCKELSNSEFAQIRQTLTTFFQDKRIKVSLFLQDGIQSADGTILLPKGGPIPNDATVEYPGKIRYFNDDSVVSDEAFTFPLNNVTSDRVDGDTYDPKTRECKLGKNMYTVDRSKKKEASKPAAKPQPTTVSTTTSSQKLKESGVTASAAAELKALRDMIGSNNPGSDFKINLFPDAPDEPGKANREICINKVSREDMERINQELVGVIGSLDIGGGNSDDKDILDLMDEASK